jgi:RNA polymerase sigma-70 factor, ECF subfamily
MLGVSRTAKSMTTAPPAEATSRPSSFEQLFAEVFDSAYGLALRLTRNRADAEDLLQDAALLAFRGFASFEPGSNFKAWFIKILTNCFKSSYRKQQRRPVAVDLQDAPELYLYRRMAQAGISVTSPDPAASLLRQLDTDQVVSALERLPEEYRVVSTMYFMEDLSYQQIAEALNCPVGTVRSRLHRGRKMLQKLLWQVAEDQGLIDRLTHRAEGESNTTRPQPRSTP